MNQEKRYPGGKDSDKKPSEAASEEPTVLDVDEGQPQPRMVSDDDEDEVDPDLGPLEEKPRQVKDEFPDDEDDEEPAQSPQARRGYDRNRPPSSLKELFEDFVPARAHPGNQKLRTHLTGKVVVDCGAQAPSYVFDWSGEQGQVQMLADKQPVDKAGDCVIKVSQDIMMEIAKGDLNPQIAIISEKMKIEGNLSLAIYFFNLVAPT